MTEMAGLRIRYSPERGKLMITGAKDEANDFDNALLQGGLRPSRMLREGSPVDWVSILVALPEAGLALVGLAQIIFGWTARNRNRSFELTKPDGTVVNMQGYSVAQITEALEAIKASSSEGSDNDD